MSRGAVALATVLMLPAMACAQVDEHMHHGNPREAATSPIDPPITITVNPEERISVVLSAALPHPVACGTAVELPVKIVNQGFITAQLEAQFVHEAPSGVALDFLPRPLKGVPEEFRSLYITLTKPGVTDLTIAFKAVNVLPDLGGRDRIHFLMRCL